MEANNNNAITTQNKHSCKLLIKNGNYTILKNKILNNEYLILDNFTNSKEEEKEKEENALPNVTTTSTTTQPKDDNDYENMTLLFKQLKSNEKNRKDEFEILLKYFGDNNGDGSKEKEMIKLYESLLVKYSDYFKYDIGNTIVQSAIFSNNKLALQSICKQLNYVITNKDFFQSIYFKKFDITKWIISSKFSSVSYGRLWGCIFKSLEHNTVTNVQEFEDYINLFEFIVLEKSLKIEGDEKEFKKELTLKFFRKCCPIGLNIKLKLLIQVSLLLHKLNLIKLSFPPVQGLLSVKHLNGLSFDNQLLETGLRDLDTSSSGKVVHNVVQFYYLVSGGQAFSIMYNDDSFRLKSLKGLMYYCKVGFEKGEINWYFNDHSVLDVKLRDSLAFGNIDLFFKQIKYVSDHIPETNPNLMLCQELFVQPKGDEFVLLKHCTSPTSRKSFVTKIIASPYPIDEWLLFCLIVGTNDIELIGHAFDKMKIASKYCTSSVSAAPKKTTKKQRSLFSESVVTAQDDGDDNLPESPYGIFYSRYSNIYSFVKSAVVLEFLYNSNFKSSRGKLDLSLIQEKSNLALLLKYESLIQSSNSGAPILTRINNQDNEVDIKDLDVTVRILKNPNIYSIVNENGNGEPTLVNISYSPDYEGYQYTTSNLNDLKFVIQSYPTDKNFGISIPLPKQSSFNITQFDLDLFNFILNNLDKFEIAPSQLNLIKYCIGKPISELNSDHLELVVSLASKYGDLNFMKLVIQQQQSENKEIINSMLADSIRYGNLSVLEYIHGNNLSQLITPLLSSGDILINCIKFNYLEIIKYLLSNNLIVLNDLLSIINNNNNNITKNSTYLYINNNK